MVYRLDHAAGSQGLGLHSAQSRCECFCLCLSRANCIACSVSLVSLNVFSQYGALVVSLAEEEKDKPAGENKDEGNTSGKSDENRMLKIDFQLTLYYRALKFNKPY